MKKKLKTPQSKGLFWIYGIHAVTEALKNPNRIKTRLLYTSEDLIPPTLTGNLKPEKVDKPTIEKYLSTDSIHQGLALEVKPLESLFLEDLLRQTTHQTHSTLIILDGITDPHNIGAILRSAAAFDVDGVIIMDKKAPFESGIMAKSASGALDIVPLIRVANLARTIAELKQSSYWIIGMDGKAEKSLHELDIPNKTAIVMGSEGSGMRRLTEESCDFLAKLPISNKMESLNVSNATAITLYDINTR